MELVTNLRDLAKWLDYPRHRAMPHDIALIRAAATTIEKQARAFDHLDSFAPATTIDDTHWR